MRENKPANSMSFMIYYPSKEAVAIEVSITRLREELRAEGKSAKEIEEIIDRFA